MQAGTPTIFPGIYPPSFTRAPAATPTCISSVKNDAPPAAAGRRIWFCFPAPKKCPPEGGRYEDNGERVPDSSHLRVAFEFIHKNEAADTTSEKIPTLKSEGWGTRSVI